jgi:hypothetical protein
MKLQAQLVYMVDEDSPKDKHLLQNGHIDYILKVLHIPNKWICVTIDRSVFKESSYVIGEIYTLKMNHLKKSISLESTGRVEPIVQNTEHFLWGKLGNKGQRDTGEIRSTKPKKLNQWMAFTYASYRKTT